MKPFFAALLVAICFKTDSSSQELTRATLISAARAGGDYLIRMQKPDGSFHYYYDAAEDRFESRRYNIVRHAGATLSLFDLYERTRDGRYLEAARSAMKFLKTRFRPAHARKAAYVLDFDEKAKLGANGLALLAFTKQIEFDRKLADRRSAARLANLILAMQRKDGSFQMRYKLRTTDEEGNESLYYPGEAMLGLVRLFGLIGDRGLLEASRRGADFLIESQRQSGTLPADAWFMQALEALYNIGHEKRYADHLIALAEAMMASQYTDSESPGHAGGFGPGPPRGTPAASRAEGLLAAYRVARLIGSPQSSVIAASLKACARFQLAQQLRSDDASLPNPERAMGGFRESSTSIRVRIDFVQHNISSLLGIANTLY